MERRYCYSVPEKTENVESSPRFNYRWSYKRNEESSSKLDFGFGDTQCKHQVKYYVYIRSQVEYMKFWPTFDFEGFSSKKTIKSYEEVRQACKEID